MHPKSSLTSSFPIPLLLIVLLIGAISEVGFCREFGIVRLKKLGGDTRDFANSDDVQSIARFAVQEHNKRANALLEFGKVLKAKEQVVAGKLYHLTLETVEHGKNAVYEATVWVKPWMNFKQLEEFKPVVPHLTTSDLGLLRVRLGWHKVPVHDPEVEEAANHAVRDIQRRSNCLSPYKLLEILQAEAEVVKDYVKYNLLLKLRMGNIKKKIKVNVQQTANGGFSLIEQLDM